MKKEKLRNLSTNLHKLQLEFVKDVLETVDDELETIYDINVYDDRIGKIQNVIEIIEELIDR